MGRTTLRTLIAGALAGAVLAVAAFVGIGVVAGTGTSGHDVTMDLYMAGTDQWQDLTQPANPGERNLLGSDLYQLGGSEAEPAPSGDVIGRRVGACTVVTTHEALCDGLFDLGDRGTMSAQLEVLLPGGNQGIAITGGTGEFAGASGSVVESQVPGHPNDRVLNIHISGVQN